MPTINGVVFYEDSQDPKSPEEQYANDNARVTRSLQIRQPGSAADELGRYNAAKALLGYAVINREVIGGVPRVWINRSTSPAGAGVLGGPGALPDFYPIQNDPALNFSLGYKWCTNISQTRNLGVCSGTDGDGTATYAATRFTAQYNTVPYFVLKDTSVEAELGPLSAGVPGGALARPDEGWALSQGWADSSRYVSRYVKLGARINTLPWGYMTSTRTFAQLPRGLPFYEATGIVKYTWHCVPVTSNAAVTGNFYSGIPWNAISTLLGCSNPVEFDVFSAQTLMFKDFDYKQYTSPFGQFLADISYTFALLPHPDTAPAVGLINKGWNSVLVLDRASIPGSTLLRYDIHTSDGALPRSRGDTTNGDNAPYPPGAYINGTVQGFEALFRPDQV